MFLFIDISSLTPMMQRGAGIFSQWKHDNDAVGAETTDNTASVWDQLESTSLGPWLSRSSGSLTGIASYAPRQHCGVLFSSYCQKTSINPAEVCSIKQLCPITLMWPCLVKGPSLLNAKGSDAGAVVGLARGRRQDFETAMDELLGRLAVWPVRQLQGQASSTLVGKAHSKST